MSLLKYSLSFCITSFFVSCCFIILLIIRINHQTTRSKEEGTWSSLLLPWQLPVRSKGIWSAWQPLSWGYLQLDALVWRSWHLLQLRWFWPWRVVLFWKSLRDLFGAVHLSSYPWWISVRHRLLNESVNTPFICFFEDIIFYKVCNFLSFFE